MNLDFFKHQVETPRSNFPEIALNLVNMPKVKLSAYVFVVQPFSTPLVVHHGCGWGVMHRFRRARSKLQRKADRYIQYKLHIICSCGAVAWNLGNIQINPKSKLVRWDLLTVVNKLPLNRESWSDITASLLYSKR